MATSTVAIEVFTAYHCQDCDALSEECQQVALYECGECGTKFNRENGLGRHGNMCPECRNKFGTKLADRHCAECGEGEVEEVEAFRCPCPNCDEVHLLDEAKL